MEAARFNAFAAVEGGDVAKAHQWLTALEVTIAILTAPVQVKEQGLAAIAEIREGLKDA